MCVTVCLNACVLLCVCVGVGGWGALCGGGWVGGCVCVYVCSL